MESDLFQTTQRMLDQDSNWARASLKRLKLASGWWSMLKRTCKAYLTEYCVSGISVWLSGVNKLDMISPIHTLLNGSCCRAPFGNIWGSTRGQSEMGTEIKLQTIMYCSTFQLHPLTSFTEFCRKWCRLHSRCLWLVTFWYCLLFLTPDMWAVTQTVYFVSQQLSSVPNPIPAFWFSPLRCFIAMETKFFIGKPKHQDIMSKMRMRNGVLIVFCGNNRQVLRINTTSSGDLRSPEVE